jgi:hypothetical protein
MPAVSVSESSMETIQRIRESSKWNPTKKEVVAKALEMLEEQEMENGSGTGEQSNEQNAEAGDN